MPEEFQIELSGSDSVSAILYPADRGNRRELTLVLGHGAGAPQKSAFMVLFAAGLASRGIDAVTFNFPYMQHGRKAPDPGPKLEACYRSVIESVRAHRGLEENKFLIGGKSMGGRIASQVAAKIDPGDDNIHGLVFMGYPLHPPGKPDQLRDKHLPQIKAPMLFVQGSKDAFGTPEELSPILSRIKAPHKLFVIEGGDHSFKVPKKGLVSQDQVYASVMDEIVAWSSQL
jgi:uncharacterized protein